MESLGKILITGYGHCRHRVALIYFVAKSEGLDVDIMYSRKDKSDECHSFIRIKKDDSEILADPTLNIFGTHSEVISRLETLGHNAYYHRKFFPMDIDLIY